MKKNISIFLLLFLCLAPARAQEKYSVVLEQVQTLSPYEAIYLLMDYQAFHPENASIYYHLGNLNYDLLSTRDPLHHYDELSALLYRTRLFYGNCLHFAKDQKLAGWQYEQLANGQKRIEYETLEQFVKPRVDEVQYRQMACDTIHHTFVRMAERYNQCQLIFTDFLNRYTRQKTAHLQLTKDEEAILQRLQGMADSLDADIEAYQTALALQPIAGYHPVFRKEPIVLYRLDGLTHTDFLQNDIAIWDYSQWVQRFLNEQHQVYDRLYVDIVLERRQLEKQLAQYASGKPISGQMDATILGRCARLEVNISHVDSIRVLQEHVRNCVAQQTIAQSTKPTSIREFIPLLQVAATRRDAVRDEAWYAMQTQLIDMAHAVAHEQTPEYIHPVSGQKIKYPAAENQTVLCLLPDEMGYRCVLTDEQMTTRVIELYYDLSIRKEWLTVPNEKALLCTKIPGSLWVLITDKQIYWLQ